MTVEFALSKLSPVATNTVAEEGTSSSLRTYQGLVPPTRIKPPKRTYMKHDTSRFTFAKNSRDVAEATNSKKNHMPSLRGKEGDHDGVFVKFESVFAVSRCQPRSPNAY